MNQPSTPSDLVLENLSWVRRLARALVQDPGHAEDLVQDTWLRVQGSPPPPGRADRSWLARVLRNLARDGRRSESRRAHRERMAARPEASTSDQDLRDLALRYETLVRWLGELDEPYRRTLLLRWLEDESVARISKDTSVPAATVQTRLRRGEALLRQRAERETQGRGMAWLSALALDPKLGTVVGRGSVLGSASRMREIVALLVVALLGTWVALIALDPFSSAPLSVDPVGPVAKRATEPEAPTLDTNSKSEPARTLAAAPIEPHPTSPSVVQGPEDSSDLLVRVVDSEGNPIEDAPVAIIVRHGDSDRRRVRARTEAATGLARFEEVETLIERNAPRGSGSKVFVGLDMPGRSDARVPLDRDALPTEILELMAPAHGRLELEIVDPKGSPMDYTGWVSATPLFQDPDRPVRWVRGERVGIPLRRSSRTVFSMVEAGITIRVELQGQGVFEGVQRDIDPLGIDEVRKLTLSFGLAHARATGRLVDQAGEPLVLRSVDVEFDPRGSTRIDSIGPDGGFSLSLEEDLDPEDPVRAELTAERLLRSANGRGSELLVGSFAVNRPPAGGEVEVGDVVMRPAPILVSGVVVDPEGLPVEGARVALHRVLGRRRGPLDLGWNFEVVASADSDPSGQFTIPGRPEEGEYILRVLDDRWADRGARHVRAGARNVRVPVDSAQDLRGRVLLPAGIDPRDFFVSLEVPEAHLQPFAYDSWRSPIEADGSFEIEGLRPGSKALHLAFLDDGASRASLRDIKPNPSHEGEARGLDPWDLRMVLTNLSFTVQLDRGLGVDAARVGLPGRTLEPTGGRFTALIDPEVVDEVVVVAPGHRPRRLSPNSVPPSVILTRGRPVRIQVEEPLPDLPEGWVAMVGLSPAAVPMKLPPEGHFSERPIKNSNLHDQLCEWVRVSPGESRWTLHAPVTGAYRPRLRVMAPSKDPVLEGGRVASIGASDRRLKVKVESIEGPTILHSTAFDPEDLRKCLEELR